MSGSPDQRVDTFTVFVFGVLAGFVLTVAFVGAAAFTRGYDQGSCTAVRYSVHNNVPTATQTCSRVVDR